MVRGVGIAAVLLGVQFRLRLGSYTRLGVRVWFGGIRLDSRMPRFVCVAW